MAARIVYIGTQEADAHAFEKLAAQDFPAIDLYATNDRTDAMSHLADAEGIIAHHFQFDEALLHSAPKLRWIQSLTTGTDSKSFSTNNSNARSSESSGVSGCTSLRMRSAASTSD